MDLVKVFVVEDEDRLRDTLVGYLTKEGYRPVPFASGEGVVEAVKSERPEMILLDLMLPGKDGIQICREVRAFSSVPIIMTTARVEEIDRLLGLEMGADDYLCKPYSVRELIARIKAVLRRVNSKDIEPAEGFVVDEERYTISYRGDDLGLTVVEYKLLKTLIDRPGIIFTRDQLMNRIYTDDRIVSDRTIDSHVKKIRHKIETYFAAEVIISVYGLGFKFEPNI